VHDYFSLHTSDTLVPNGHRAGIGRLTRHCTSLAAVNGSTYFIMKAPVENRGSRRCMALG
jgi:hypothetical protein